MVDIVAELTKAGMSDEWIKKNIGMDATNFYDSNRYPA